MNNKNMTMIASTMLTIISTTLPTLASTTSGYGVLSSMDNTLGIVYSTQIETQNLSVKQPILMTQLTIDVSGVPESVANGVIGLLGYLGIQPSGTVKENDEVWCVFNEWAARDQRASSAGAYDYGRFSIGTTFGGRWYCYTKNP